MFVCPWLLPVIYLLFILGSLWTLYFMDVWISLIVAFNLLLCILGFLEFHLQFISSCMFGFLWLLPVICHDWLNIFDCCQLFIMYVWTSLIFASELCLVILRLFVFYMLLSLLFICNLSFMLLLFYVVSLIALFLFVAGYCCSFCFLFFFLRGRGGVCRGQCLIFASRCTMYAHQFLFRRYWHVHHAFVKTIRLTSMIVYDVVF